jgi:hypothetical protein
MSKPSIELIIAAFSRDQPDIVCLSLNRHVEPINPSNGLYFQLAFLSNSFASLLATQTPDQEVFIRSRCQNDELGYVNSLLTDHLVEPAIFLSID